MAKKHIRFAIGTLALGFSGIVAAPAKADPPSWAPAHGARAKHGDGGHHNKGHDFGADGYGDLFLPNGNVLQCNRDVIGAILGGAAGAVAGSTIGKGDGKLLATIGGAIFGMLAGNAIGSGMDAADSACSGYALDRLPDGQTATWTNPDSKQQYSITPVKTFKNEDDQYCREYNASVKINGAQQKTLGTACLQPDGSWRLLS
ncbi:RT0821/Lpp0805 family surface protein [Thalassospira sp. TSL5-1]|uniref:RT0821/Lpp0805 family surface protein n=1 Tax=Thalassospira sp. TSL5-1 TaxID=1544451 RepID=UPI00093E78EC|nr:RT0821/Lpp0805 family surface protein [Thalassospira sp. TSL5-1]